MPMSNLRKLTDEPQKKKLIVEPLKKERKKENEKGSLENYLAGDYRCTYCRRHYARRYQLHVN